jgi:hypothetical protein
MIATENCLTYEKFYGDKSVNFLGRKINQFQRYFSCFKITRNRFLKQVIFRQLEEVKCY